MRPQSGQRPTAACLVPQRPVALAIGVRSNSPMPYLTPGIANIVNTAISAHETVAMVRLDGYPKVIFNQPSPRPGATPSTQHRIQHLHQHGVNGILQGSSQPTTDIQAQVGQADDLGGLDVAASEVPAGGDVVMIDSGVQTKEPLNFATGLLERRPADDRRVPEARARTARPHGQARLLLRSRLDGFTAALAWASATAAS